jgi:hypothetical protein
MIAFVAGRWYTCTQERFMLGNDISTTDFALSENGIHLLRDGYNYKTIGWQRIDKATIKKGPEIKNPLLSLAAGLALVTFAGLKAISLYQDFADPAVHRIYIEAILLPLFPALIGVYFLYAYFKKGLILQVKEGRSVCRLRLHELEKQNGLAGLKSYLHQKLSSRLLVMDNG